MGTCIYAIAGCKGPSEAISTPTEVGPVAPVYCAALGSGPTMAPGCDDGGPCTEPPVSSGSATTATTPQNFALHHIHLGEEADCNGNPDWYLYGYNLDGKDTTESSTDVCTLQADANRRNQDDGPGGIDNSFGKNVVAGLLQSVTSPSASTDKSLALGQYTLMMDVSGLVPTAGQTATGLTAMLFAGVPFGQGPNASTAMPTWTTADNWPLDPSYVASLVDGTSLTPPATSTETFADPYVVRGVFVSGLPTNVTLTLTLFGAPLVLPIQHAVITFEHPGASDSGVANSHLSGGVIAGVIDAETLANGLRANVGNLERALCEGTVFEQLAQRILQAADIMDDGSNSPGTPCNGVSIGVGFDADEIGLPRIVGAPSPYVSPCVDAGTDEG